MYCANGFEKLFIQERFEQVASGTVLHRAQNLHVAGVGAEHNDSRDARIIMLSTYAGDVQVLRAMKDGARGYLLKTLLDKELLETIRAVHAGKKMLSAEASFELAEHATSDALTPGEIDV